MVSTSFVSILSTSIVITIACSITAILRLTSPEAIAERKRYYSWGDRDFFSKDMGNYPTPSSATLRSSSTSSASASSGFSLPLEFYVPSNETYYSPAVSLGYILTGLFDTKTMKNSNESSSSSSMSEKNIQLVNRLKNQMNSSKETGTIWTNVVNTSVGFSSSLELGVVSANSSRDENHVNKDCVAFLERSLGIDGSPIMYLSSPPSEKTNEKICSWKIIVGFTEKSFLVVDPGYTTTSTTNGASSSSFQKLAEPALISRSDMYRQWHCRTDGSTSSPSGMKNLAIAFRKRN